MKLTETIRPKDTRQASGNTKMHAPTPRENAADPRAMPPDYRIRQSDEEVMNALVVEAMRNISELLAATISLDVMNSIAVSGC